MAEKPSTQERWTCAVAVLEERSGAESSEEDFLALVRESERCFGAGIAERLCEARIDGSKTETRERANLLSELGRIAERAGHSRLAQHSWWKRAQMDDDANAYVALTRACLQCGEPLRAAMVLKRADRRSVAHRELSQLRTIVALAQEEEVSLANETQLSDVVGSTKGPEIRQLGQIREEGESTLSELEEPKRASTAPPARSGVGKKVTSLGHGGVPIDTALSEDAVVIHETRLTTNTRSDAKPSSPRLPAKKMRRNVALWALGAALLILFVVAAVAVINVASKHRRTEISRVLLSAERDWRSGEAAALVRAETSLRGALELREDTALRLLLSKVLLTRYLEEFSSSEALEEAHQACSNTCPSWFDQLLQRAANAASLPQDSTPFPTPDNGADAAFCHYAEARMRLNVGQDSAALLARAGTEFGADGFAPIRFAEAERMFLRGPSTSVAPAAPDSLRLRAWQCNGQSLDENSFDGALQRLLCGQPSVLGDSTLPRFVALECAARVRTLENIDFARAEFPPQSVLIEQREHLLSRASTLSCDRTRDLHSALWARAASVQLKFAEVQACVERVPQLRDMELCSPDTRHEGCARTGVWQGFADAREWLGDASNREQLARAESLFSELETWSVRAPRLAREARVGRIQAMLAQGKSAEAAALYAQSSSLTLGGSDSFADDELAIRVGVLLAQNRVADAMETLRTHPAADAVHAVAIGDTLLSSGRVAEAAAYLDECIRRFVGSPLPLLRRSEMYLRGNASNSALSLLARARPLLAAASPATRADHSLQVARALLMQHQFARAASELRRLLALPNPPAEAHYYLGEALSPSASARESFLQYLALAPNGALAERARRATALHAGTTR